MLRLLRPVVDHVDQLFKAVQSLGSDLADEQARSRGKQEEISLRLSDIDRTVSGHLMKLANVAEEQQGCDIVVQAKFDQWLAEVLEPTLQQQNNHLADRLSNIDGQMQTMLSSSQEKQFDKWLAEVLEPRLQEQNNRQADRLSILDGQMQAILNSSQEKQFDRWLAEVLEPRLHEQNNRHAHRVSILDEQMQSMLNSRQDQQFDKWLEEVLEPRLQEQNNLQADRLSILDEQMQAKLISSQEKQLDKWFAEVFEPRLQEHNNHHADRLGILDGQMQAKLDSLQDKQFEKLRVEVLEPMLKELNNRHADRFSNLDGQVQSMLNSSQDKQSGIEGKLENLSKGLDEVVSGLAATNSRLAEKLESSSRLHSKGLATSDLTCIRFATDGHQGRSEGIQPVPGTPLSSARMLTGPTHANMQLRPTEGVQATSNVSLGGSTPSGSVETIRSASKKLPSSSTATPALPSRALVVKMHHEEWGHQ